MLDCKATDVDDATVDPRFGKVGKQTIKDTGALTKKRMETMDDEIADRAVDFIKRENAAGKPAFVWVNFTHMHFRTHTKPESIGQSGRFQSFYHDAIDHAFVLVPAQAIVGQFLATFKEFPPSQASASFSIDKVVEKLQQGATDGP